MFEEPRVLVPGKVFGKIIFKRFINSPGREFGFIDFFYFSGTDSERILFQQASYQGFGVKGMASCKIEWKSSAAKELRKLDRETIRRVLAAVEALAIDPYPQGTRKIKGSSRSYRIRVGEYRIIYCIQEGPPTVEIIRVGHRRAIYRPGAP